MELETDLEAGASNSQLARPSVETASGLAEGESKGGEDGKGEEASEAPAGSDKGGDDDSESSSEMDKLSDSESLDQKLAGVDDGPLHIEESYNSQGDLSNLKENGLENGAVSGMKELSVSTKVCSIH